MKELKKYECSYCGKEFAEQKDCEKHENKCKNIQQKKEELNTLLYEFFNEFKDSDIYVSLDVEQTEAKETTKLIVID